MEWNDWLYGNLKRSRIERLAFVKTEFAFVELRKWVNKHALKHFTERNSKDKVRNGDYQVDRAGSFATLEPIILQFVDGFNRW